MKYILLIPFFYLPILWHFQLWIRQFHKNLGNSLLYFSLNNLRILENLFKFWILPFGILLIWAIMLVLKNKTILFGSIGIEEISHLYIITHCISDVFRTQNLKFRKKSIWLKPWKNRNFILGVSIKNIIHKRLSLKFPTYIIFFYIIRTYIFLICVLVLLSYIPPVA